MFSNLFSSSISLATVTPSLVTVGAPHDFSMTTLRPRGPSVTLTASASVLTPARMRARALSSKIMSLAPMFSPFVRSTPLPLGGATVRVRAPSNVRRRTHPHPDPLPRGEGIGWLLLDHAEDLFLAQ